MPAAAATLARLGCSNMHVRHADALGGWPDHAPFDAIMVTCAPADVPPALVKQLKEGGRFILPVGAWLSQRLVILRKVRGRQRVRAPRIPANRHRRAHARTGAHVTGRGCAAARALW